jgi:polyribonucleotide nucleotidyltransferase
VQEDGTVYIAAPEGPGAKIAQERVEALGENAVIGNIYTGKVVRLTDFGAFVEILPGVDGLVHISQLDSQRVNKVEDVVTMGDEITVMVTDIVRGRMAVRQRCWKGGQQQRRAKRTSGGRPVVAGAAAGAAAAAAVTIGAAGVREAAVAAVIAVVAGTSRANHEVEQPSGASATGGLVLVTGTRGCPATGRQHLYLAPAAWRASGILA